ncbi:RNA methyltransferase, TrmH family [Chitinophaga costaii]|uniref:RNA methyltransferase, TrmH family n=2 Tax=Chitinophaga costaii TaxID=1335309 RepID=A0A1C3ZQ60_9BACT|nr:RNA methyltransferase [Chitinophaga costaii]SCB84539.1 RNA methyltransferase, TrmH family [Chitinophaga costaii]
MLAAAQPMEAVYATAPWMLQHRPLLDKVHRLEVNVVTEEELARISSLTTPNQALAVLPIPGHAEPAAFREGVALALEDIQDPGNMGTIIRIADWFGIAQIVCSPGCVDAYNPKTVQATMGSIARVKIVEAGLPEVLQHAGVASYAATLHGKNIGDFEPITEGIIVIGNESRGLHPATMALCTERVTIPRLGFAESLNAAVATGIICGRLLIR